MTKLLLIVGLLLPTNLATQTGDTMCRPASALRWLDDLPEASGVTAGSARSGLLFAIADSGPPAIVVLDQAGAVVRKAVINGVRKDDWEAIASARCGEAACLYIADIGDNNRSRRSIVIYRVDESATARAEAVQADAFELTYPDGSHDAEAIFVRPDGHLFVVTKERGRASVYRTSHPLRAASQQALIVAATLPWPEEKGVTDAAASPDGQWIALRSNDAVRFYRAADLIAGRAGTPLQADLRGLKEPQGEGLAFGANGTLYLIGEGSSRNRPGSFVTLRCTLPTS